MDPYLTFFMDHLWTFLLLIMLIIYAAFMHQDGECDTHWSVEEALAAFNEDQAMFVDIRSEKAYQAGRIKGAQRWDSTQSWPKFFDKKTCVFYCEQGLDALKIVREQQAKETKTVMKVLSGGLKQWQEAGLPIVSGKKND